MQVDGGLHRALLTARCQVHEPAHDEQEREEQDQTLHGCACLSFVSILVITGHYQRWVPVGLECRAPRNGPVCPSSLAGRWSRSTATVHGVPEGVKLDRLLMRRDTRGAGRSYVVASLEQTRQLVTEIP